MADMKSWKGIHDNTFAELRRRYRLNAVALKHAFPERPWRLLGLLKFDGEAYCSERFVRALLLKTTLPGGASRSLLLCPRVEYNFPVFSNETILMGKRVLFLVDVQQVFPSPGRTTGSLLDDLQSIRSRYQDLLEDPAAVSGEIARGFSPAAVYVRLDPSCYARAADLLQQYLLSYLDALDSVSAVDEMHQGARQAFDAYADLVINHDPAMRFLRRMFGAAGARERAYDMFFGK
jgi:hypothetical protein